MTFREYSQHIKNLRLGKQKNVNIDTLIFNIEKEINDINHLTTLWIKELNFGLSGNVVVVNGKRYIFNDLMDVWLAMKGE